MIFMLIVFPNWTFFFWSHVYAAAYLRTWSYATVRCSWSIACRRCSNYIFILDLIPGCIGLGKDNCTTRRETFKFSDWVRLILETLWLHWCHTGVMTSQITGNSAWYKRFVQFNKNISSPMPGSFSPHRVNNAEMLSMSWPHHESIKTFVLLEANLSQIILTWIIWAIERAYKIYLRDLHACIIKHIFHEECIIWRRCPHRWIPLTNGQ